MTELASGAERARITLCFCVMAGMILVLAGRLAYLQIGLHDSSARRVALRKAREEALPAPRCRIVDRQGALLAHDRPVYEARGEAYFRVNPDGTPKELGRAIDRLVSDLVLVLERDLAAVPDLAAAERQRKLLEQRLHQRGAKSLVKLAKRVRDAQVAGEKFKPRWVKVDFPIHNQLVDAAAVLALRALDVRRRERGAARRPYRLWVHLERRFERVYAAPLLTAGLVGRVRDERRKEGFRQAGVSGLERLSIARPRAAGGREYEVDARLVPYWTPRRRSPNAPLLLRTTIDLELQRAAQRHLEFAVESVAEQYGGPPEWGAMLAVDVASGGVLAMASFQQAGEADGEIENNWLGQFAPTECAFEPGSVVKPLVLALALERGVLDWNARFDCSQLRLPLERDRKLRVIRDSHRCGVLTPRGILVNSSNIGAVRAGMSLGAAGLDEYLARFQFLPEVDLPLPRARQRLLPKSPVAKMRSDEQRIWTGPSLCYGYGLQTTVAHLARAYLTLLSGRERQLRLVEAIECEGEVHPVAQADADTQRFLAPATIGRVVESLVAMVDGEEGATAARLTAMLHERGVPKGLIAGKTGTSEFWLSKSRQNMTRTASFVGFAPAGAPRVLALCVVQKNGAASFYGGTYAGPAAGRLLLDALERRQHRTSGRGRVSALSSGGISTGDVVRGRSASRQKGR